METKSRARFATDFQVVIDQEASVAKQIKRVMNENPAARSDADQRELLTDLMRIDGALLMLIGEISKMAHFPMVPEGKKDENGKPLPDLRPFESKPTKWGSRLEIFLDTKDEPARLALLRLWAIELTHEVTTHSLRHATS